MSVAVFYVILMLILVVFGEDLIVLSVIFIIDVYIEMFCT